MSNLTMLLLAALITAVLVAPPAVLGLVLPDAAVALIGDQIVIAAIYAFAASMLTIIVVLPIRNRPAAKAPD